MLHCIAWQRGAEDAHADMESPIVRDAEGMESLIVRKTKAMAYLCELKSRRSPKRSLFCAKSRRHGKSFGNNAEGILVCLKNIAFSSKIDASIAGV